MTSEETIEALGLEQFALLDDIGAWDAISRFEQHLERPLDDPHALQDPTTRACLHAFIYGYRLGERPKDTHHEQSA